MDDVGGAGASGGTRVEGAKDGGGGRDTASRGLVVVVVVTVVVVVVVVTLVVVVPNPDPIDPITKAGFVPPPPAGSTVFFHTFWFLTISYGILATRSFQDPTPQMENPLHAAFEVELKLDEGARRDGSRASSTRGRIRIIRGGGPLPRGRLQRSASVAGYRGLGKRDICTQLRTKHPRKLFGVRCDYPGNNMFRIQLRKAVVSSRIPQRWSSSSSSTPSAQSSSSTGTPLPDPNPVRNTSSHFPKPN